MGGEKLLKTLYTVGGSNGEVQKKGESEISEKSNKVGGYG